MKVVTNTFVNWNGRLHRKYSIECEIRHYKHCKYSTDLPPPNKCSYTEKNQFQLEASYSHPRIDLVLQHFNDEEIFDFTSNNFVRSEYFKFVTVAPLVFRFFRDFYGINYQSFQDSIASSTFVKCCSQRAFMLYPHKRFAIKSLTKREFKTLKKMLPAFYTHLTDRTPTVLPKYIGLYILEKKRKRRMFVLLDDYFPKDLFTPMETFSFRNRSSEEFLQRYPEGFLMKENHHNEFFAIIENDVNFLEKFHIIGYALQMKVCRKKNEEALYTSANMFRGYNSFGEEFYFHVGFIDCLENKGCDCLLYRSNYSMKLKNILEEDIFPTLTEESSEDLPVASTSANNIGEIESDSQMRLIIPNLKLDIIEEEKEGEGDYDNIPIPKFGEAKSPSNVGDWLRIHEDIGIIKSGSCKVTRFVEEELTEETSSPKKSMKGSRKSETNSTSFSPKVTRFAEEEVEETESPRKSLIDTRKSFRNKSIKSDRTSVFTGRSFRGSITRGFIPSPLDRKKSKDVDQDVSTQSKQPKHQQYFEYIDLALNDVDDQEENLLFSLCSILEAKRDIKEMMKMT